MPADVPRILLGFAAGILKREGQQLIAVGQLIEDLAAAEPPDPSLPAPAAPKLRIVKGTGPMAMQFFAEVTPSPAAPDLDPSVVLTSVEYTPTVMLPDGSPPTTGAVVTRPFDATKFNMPDPVPLNAHVTVTEVQVSTDGKRTHVSPAASVFVTDPNVLDATPDAPGLRIVAVDTDAPPAP